MKTNDRRLYGLAVALPAAVCALLLTASCSTTRRIGEGEILYTGVKKMNIEVPAGTRIGDGVDDQLKQAINVAPNNCLISPSIRYPFPLGLWVYNNWPNPPSGFKHWIYKKLAADPVLISEVRPEARTAMLSTILDNNGYFNHTVNYELAQGKNKKKASVIYNVITGPAYELDSIIMLPDTCRLNHMIDSIASRSRYLRRGQRYCTDSLSQLRVNIANALRNRGYYFFNPSYIEYLADSTITPGKIALKLDIADDLPHFALQRYRTGTITTRVYRNEGGGTPDTLTTRRGEVIVMRPARLRDDLIPSCITFRTGKTFSVRDMNNTQAYLARLGIFNGITINAVPDSTAAEPTLNVDIACTFDTPLEASVEVNVSSKSNSYLGPGATVGVTSRNLFGGGEQFNISLTGAYEWQTGRNRGKDASLFNSYEFNLSTSLAFPRLLAPRFIPRRRRQLNWTRISLSADLLNRPHYFRLAEFNTAFTYDWRVSRHVTNSFTPFKLSYTKLINTTEAFDSVMDANPAIAESFRSQFIPQLSYSYTYERNFHNRHTLNITFTVQEAGNLFWSIWELAGQKGEKKLFGTPFSQFVKGTFQVVYGRRISGQHWIVSRMAVGAAHAYGNSSQVPYSEQFYIGGANSIRAFTVRSLGPGSYRPAADAVNGYFDQTGTFKFEANVEYRFPLIGPLHGATFIDLGNVWLLKDDPRRPGGTLRASTFLRDLAVGTGVGLRFDIGMLVVRGDLGIAVHAPYDTGKRGYFNIPKFKDALAFHLAIGYPF